MGRRRLPWKCALWVLCPALLLSPVGITASWFLAALHVTFWHSGITAKMWMQDVRYVFCQPQPASKEVTFPFKPGDNHTAHICRLSMYVKGAEELHSGNIMSPIRDSRVTLPPAERAEAYLNACQEVFQSLPPEQRRILELLDPVPSPSQFHLNVTHAWMNGRWTPDMYDMWIQSGGHDPAMGTPGNEYPKGSDAEWFDEREVQAASLPSLKNRLKPLEELQRLPPALWKGFQELGIWPVRDEYINVEEIPHALRQGRTVVFDATKLCGKDIFNLTIPDIARLHEATADDIPAFKVNSAGCGDFSFDSLAELAQRFKNWNDMGWQDYPDFGPFNDRDEIKARDERTTPKDPLLLCLQWFMTSVYRYPREEAEALIAPALNAYRQVNTQTTINVRRLPHFPLQDMHKAMGSPAWVERLWNLLWIGPVGDFWHFDEEDNLLICVSGSIYVAVMEQNVTDVVSGTRNIGLGFNNLEGFFNHKEKGRSHWVDKNRWIEKIPIHFLKLEPGMGITIPSRTYHNVMALDGNRILMNCFFFRKFGEPETNSQSWYRPGSQSDTYRAMRHLKATSIWQLWDTQAIGGFFSGYKLEFF
mmetsp:Transcript_71440/g.209404  ORF Transcript_71440/g.209404 Transcript_71440/m.209404 type:complete len:589 (+) Transcript_71440:77-1843(+)